MDVSFLFQDLTIIEDRQNKTDQNVQIDQTAGKTDEDAQNGDNAQQRDNDTDQSTDDDVDDDVDDQSSHIRLWLKSIGKVFFKQLQINSPPCTFISYPTKAFNRAWRNIANKKHNSRLTKVKAGMYNNGKYIREDVCNGVYKFEKMSG